MSGVWPTIGHIAGTAGVTTVGFGLAKGVLAGYRNYASPSTCLMKSEAILEKVRLQLQRLSPKRREEIEIATRSESFNGLSLKTLEKQLDDLTSLHCKLSLDIEESTFTERHSPYSEFRELLSKFERHAKALLNDTLKTTASCVDDSLLKPENSRRPTERPSNSGSTLNPENSIRATERPPDSEPTFNPESSTRAMERSSSSKSTFNLEDSGWPRWATETFTTTRDSFSDLGDIPLSPGRMV